MSEHLTPSDRDAAPAETLTATDDDDPVIASLPEAPSWFLNIYVHAYIQFVLRYKGIEEINEAVNYFADCLDLIPPGHRLRNEYTELFNCALMHRYERLSDLDDLDRAIAGYEEIVATQALDESDRTKIGNYSIALKMRFGRSGRPEDLDRAIELCEKLCDGASEQEEREHSCSALLANTLLYRYERFIGQDRDLDRAIELYDAVLASMPARVEGAKTEGERTDRDLHEHTLLNNAAGALLTKFDRFQKTGDIDRAIELYERALPLGTSAERPSSLVNLGAALSKRSEHLADLSDLDRAISIFEEVLSGELSHLTDRLGVLSNLGTSLSTRFRHNRKRADIQRGISLLETVVAETRAGDPLRQGRLYNLAIMLLDRFRLDGARADLDRLILLVGEAVSETPDDATERPHRLALLASGLAARFLSHWSGEKDLLEAVACLTEALALLPVDHPQAASYHRTQQHLLDTASGGWLSLDALKTLRPWLELRAAQALLAVDPEEAFERALAVLKAPDTPPALCRPAATLTLDARDRSLRAARDPVGLMFSPWGDGLDEVGPAAAGLALEQPGLAALFADRGQGAVASRLAVATLDIQALMGDSRTRGAAVLYQGALHGLTRLVDRRASGEAVPYDSLERAWTGLDTALVRLRRDAARPWLARAVAEFADLQEVARLADVVLVHLLPLADRGVALVTPPDGDAFAIDLPDLDRASVRRRMASFARLSDAAAPESRDWMVEQAGDLCGWLSHAVVEPLVRRLGNDRRCVLIPTGDLSGLPLLPAHPQAAALAGGAAVVGWAATAEARKTEVSSGPAGTLLIVPTARDLALGPAMAARLRDDDRLATAVLAGRKAAAADILDALRTPRRLIVYWGHGAHDPDDHTRCGLVLDDGVLSPNRIIERVGDLAGAIVVLAACDGGRSVVSRRAEALGLPLAFIRLGAAAVVSAAWPVNEASTALLVDRLVANLAAGGTVSAALAASQRSCADEGVDEKRKAYAALIHAGYRAAGLVARVMKLVRRGDDLEEKLRAASLDRWNRPYHWAAFSVYGNPNARL